MFDFLCQVNRRPEPFSAYTARDLWTDPHTSHKMLAHHLDPTVDAASRNLQAGVAVADFGCGPGLYAQRLARSGAAVTGIDFSANSLRYARETALQEGLAIDYIEADYLAFSAEKSYGLILMIMCDFCALSPQQRAGLLQRFRSHLAPGGSVLLDVYSSVMFDSRVEAATYAPGLLGGFWSEDEYFGFLNTFKYDDRRLLLDKYTIVERTRTYEVFNWLQCFATTELEEELGDSGLKMVELRGDVAGAAFDESRSEFAVVASAI
jgi:SAM-dependent methyltransferase